MTTILAVLAAVLLAGFAPGTAWAWDYGCKTCSQKCAVINCASPTPNPREPSMNDSGSGDRARYEQALRNANETFDQANASPSEAGKLDDYYGALVAFQRVQALHDGPSVQTTIAQIRALMTWYSGVREVRMKNYSTAVEKLMAAFRSRPELFSEANWNFLAGVNQQFLAQQPNASEATFRRIEDATRRSEEADPTLVNTLGLESGLQRSVEVAIDNIFANSPSGVRERVRKGFQAVMARDWKVARAWFQDALNRDPGNIALMSFIATVDTDPTNPQWSTRLAASTRRKNPLFALREDASTMTTQEIMQTLDSILLEGLSRNWSSSSRLSPR